jgi:hypothetical protein
MAWFIAPAVELRRRIVRVDHGRNTRATLYQIARDNNKLQKTSGQQVRLPGYPGPMPSYALEDASPPSPPLSPRNPANLETPRSAFGVFRTSHIRKAQGGHHPRSPRRRQCTTDTDVIPYRATARPARVSCHTPCLPTNRKPPNAPSTYGIGIIHPYSPDLLAANRTPTAKELSSATTKLPESPAIANSVPSTERTIHTLENHTTPLKCRAVYGNGAGAGILDWMMPWVSPVVRPTFFTGIRETGERLRVGVSYPLPASPCHELRPIGLVARASAKSASHALTKLGSPLRSS